MKQEKILTGFFALLLSMILSVPAFGAVYRQSKERYPQSPFMIIFESEGNGSYVLGIKNGTWILRSLYDIKAVDNDDPDFLFSFEERSSDKNLKSNERLWNANHSMALKCSEGYLDFDSTGVEFFNAVPVVSAEPQYHWQYIEQSDTGTGNYLKYKYAYGSGGKSAAIWAKANAQETYIMLTECGKGSSVYFHEESVGEELPFPAKGGWQEYTNSYNQHGWKYINPDGTLKQEEWHVEKGKSYYLGADGITLFGFHQLPNGKYYYFRPDGSLLTNSEISIKGIPYRMGRDGVCKRVSDKAPERQKSSVRQYDWDDEVINWINLKRAELGLNPLYRDNRLSAMASDVIILDADLDDWKFLDDLAADSDIDFKRQSSFRFNWNEKIRRFSLEQYYKKGGFKQLVEDPRLNHIGIYSSERSGSATKDILIMVGYY